MQPQSPRALGIVTSAGRWHPRNPRLNLFRATSANWPAQIFRPAAKHLSEFCRRPFSLLSDQKIAEANLPAKVASRCPGIRWTSPASATKWSVFTSWTSSWSISSPSSRSSSWLPLAGSSMGGVCLVRPSHLPGHRGREVAVCRTTRQVRVAIGPRIVLLDLTNSPQCLHSTNFTHVSSRRSSELTRKFLTRATAREQNRFRDFESIARIGDNSESEGERCPREENS